MKKTCLNSLGVAVITGVLLAPSVASAGLADLAALQQANANLVAQYDFEGADDLARLADGSGNAYTLQRVAGTDGGATTDIQFVAGYDGVSQAYQPSYDTSNYRIGAGLNSVSTTVPIGASITVEAVIQLDSFVLPTGGSGAYVLSARPQPSNGRAYFVRQLDDPTVRLTSTFGDTFGDTPAVLDYTPDDWYYFVVTADYDSGGNQTSVNWWGANLSASESTLQSYGSDNTTFQGDWTGTTQLGIGNFLNGSQEYLQGRIDNVALTGEVLGQTALQTRLDALNIVVPEPSTFALAAIGGLALFARRRQR